MKYMSKYNELKGMELHSTMQLDWARVVRVYNGWIYYNAFSVNDAGVFVPENVDVNADCRQGN